MVSESSHAKTAGTEKSKGTHFLFGSPIFGYDFFISFKLGPPPVGAQSYASDLARRLRKLDFTVFFSEEEAPPGAMLDATLVKALHHSRILVVIANEGAILHSQWVRKEVEEFRRKHPKHPIIPINVDRAIEKYGPQAEVSRWLDHDGRIWLDETSQALAEGIMRPEVLKRLEVAPRFAKAITKFRRLVSVIILILIGLTSLAIYEAWDANHKRNVAVARSLASQADLAFVQGVGNFERSALLAIESMKREPLFENHSALSRAVTRLPIAKLATGAGVDELAFSADGQYLATKSGIGYGADGAENVRVFEMETGKETAHRGFDPRNNAIALNPNGRYVAMANSGKVHILELPMLNEVSVIDGADPVSHLLFDPSGRLLAIGRDKDVRVVDPASGKELAILQHQGSIRPVVFSPRGQYLACVENRTVWVFESASGKEVRHLDHEKSVSAVAFSPAQDGGYIATGSGNRGDAIERFFSTASGSELAPPIHYQDSIITVNFSPDMVTVAAGSWDYNLKLWDIKYQKQRQATIAHKGPVYAVAFSPDGGLVATGSDTASSGGKTRVFGANSGKELADFEPGGETRAVAFSSDGKYLAAGEKYGDVLVYSAASVQKSRRLMSENGGTLTAFGPDASRLAALASDAKVSVVDTMTGKVLSQFTLEGSASTLAFSLDGRSLAVADNKAIWIIEAATGKSRVRINYDGDVRALAFTPDGRRLASAVDDYTNNNETIQLWDAETGKKSTGIIVQNATIYSLAFSSDERLIAAGTDKDFRVMEAETGKEHMRIVQNGEVNAIAFSPDGEKLAIGTKFDKIVHVLDLATGKELLRFTPDDEIFLYGVDAISFSPDGRYLDITQGLTQSQVILLPEDLMNQACSRLTRNLSEEEWRQYFDEVPYQKTCTKEDTAANKTL